MPLKPSDLEASRLAALGAYQILDTPPEPTFDRLTRAAAHLLRAPFGAICLIAENRQFFKSWHAPEGEMAPRTLALCNHAIHSDAVFVIPGNDTGLPATRA